MAEQDARGKGESLKAAIDDAANDAAGKWGQGQHGAHVKRIEVSISANPGAIQEYRVVLSRTGA